MGVSGNEVEELSKAQSNIEHMKMRHKSGTLSELRSMTNPPTMVKTTLESVCLLLGEKVDSWRSIKSVISKNTFLLNIIQLKTDDISDQTIRMMKKKYMSNPLYTVDHVARVSTACAPLVKWCLAHVTYADIVRGKEMGGKVEEGNKRDSLGTDEESLEDSFELEEAAIEREEMVQVEENNVPVESNERIKEVVEMAVKEEESAEEIVEKEELNEPADETVEKEELIEPPEETVEEKELNESTEERVEETKEILEEEVKEEPVSIEEISNDDLQESSNTLLVEEEETPVIETKEELIIKKVDTLCKDEDPIVNEEESLGREV